MILLLYIFLGILLFDCLLVCCLYFRNEIPFEQDEENSNYRETLKSTTQGIKLLKVK
jgi:hypothetical protein